MENTETETDIGKEYALAGMGEQAAALARTITDEWEDIRSTLLNAVSSGDTPPAYIGYVARHDMERCITLEYLLQNLLYEINALVCGSDDETQE